MDLYIATYTLNPGMTPLIIRSTANGYTATNEREAFVAIPEMTDGIDAWSALEATVGKPYDPSSHWMFLGIPALHYQTIVEIDGQTRLDEPGTYFGRSRQAELVITSDTRTVKTSVYWRPGGTSDRSLWKLLASTDEAEHAAVPLERRRFAIVR